MYIQIITLEDLRIKINLRSDDFIKIQTLKRTEFFKIKLLKKYNRGKTRAQLIDSKHN